MRVSERYSTKPYDSIATTRQSKPKTIHVMQQRRKIVVKANVKTLKQFSFHEFLLINLDVKTRTFLPCSSSPSYGWSLDYNTNEKSFNALRFLWKLSIDGLLLYRFFSKQPISSARSDEDVLSGRVL